MKNKQIAFPICAYTLTRKRSKQVALKYAADVCLYFKVHFKNEVRRLFFVLLIHLCELIPAL